MAWVEVHGGQRSLAFELSFRAQRSLAFELTTVPHNHRTVTTRLVLVQEGAFSQRSTLQVCSVSCLKPLNDGHLLTTATFFCSQVAIVESFNRMLNSFKYR